MACFHSKPAWKSTLPNEKGAHPINFNFRDDKTPDYFIDCGRCEGCRAAQKRDWAIRMTHESQMHERNSFVTLTYDDEHCLEQIQKTDIQLFVKRLRDKLDNKIRYFVTGEYGEHTRRPHYHAIIFGEDFRGGRYTYRVNDKLWGNKALEEIWKNGQIRIGDFTHSSALYTAGYTAKKIGDKDTFSLQSRSPPIGRTWLAKNHDNIRRIGSVVVEGKEYPVPKVYWNWLKGEECFDQMKEELAAKTKVLNDQKLRAKKLNYQSSQNLRSHKI